MFPGGPGRQVPEKLFGIIGHPLGHSLSPAIHNQAFARNNLPFVYLPWPITPDDLVLFLQAMRLLPISGLSVTIPHKERVLPLLDRVTPRAERTRAVNTVYWVHNELWGENTDCTGFVSPLLASGLQPETAMILGTGGAARACCQGLNELGTRRIFVSGRDRQRLKLLEANFGILGLDWEKRGEHRVDLLVNATPLGMAGVHESRSPYPDPEPGKCPIVYDLVYNPLQTRLLRRAKQRGCTCISGLEMFVHQAGDQFRLWTGQEFPGGEAKELVLQIVSRG